MPIYNDATIQGKVTDAAFYGESIHYFVKIDGVEKPIAIAMPNYFHTVNHQRGDTVWLGVQGASVIDLGTRDNNT